jgi:hypothetical protein
MMRRWTRQPQECNRRRRDAQQNKRNNNTKTKSSIRENKKTNVRLCHRSADISRHTHSCLVCARTKCRRLDGLLRLGSVQLTSSYSIGCLFLDHYGNARSRTRRSQVQASCHQSRRTNTDARRVTIPEQTYSS